MAGIRLNKQDKTIKVVNRKDNIRLKKQESIINLHHTGRVGPDGPVGPGVPEGGTAGQLLAKNSDTDYDTGWVPASLGGSTDLGATLSSADVTITSNTGADATIPAVDGTNAGVMTPAQKSKLDGIEAGATADMTAPEILAAVKTVDGAGSGLDADTVDGNEAATLLSRSSHTGTQTRSTISDFDAGVSANVDVAANTAARHTHANKTTLDATTAAYTTAEQTKLAGIEAGATADQTPSEILTAVKTVDGAGSGLDADTVDGNQASALLDRGNHTGTQTADTLTDGVTNKVYTAAEKTKLAGIAPGATANDTDANLRNRATHTGSQPLSTISDVTASAAEVNILDGATLSTAELNYVDGVTSAIQTQLDGKAASSHTHATTDVTGLDEKIEDVIGSKVVAGSNVTVSYDDTTGETTIAAAGSGGGSGNVPAGGSSGQYLVKATNADYDTDWATLPVDVSSLNGETGPVTIEGANIGVGTPVYNQVTNGSGAITLEFKNLKSSDGSLDVTGDATDVDITAGSGIVKTTGDQTVQGEKIFDSAHTQTTGRLGVGTPAYGPSRLGDSVLQAADIDTQNFNLKDGLKNTLASWFATSGVGYVVSTLRSFLSNDFTLRITGKARDLSTEDGAAVLALINEDATGANVEGLDMFAQRYLSGTSDVAQTAGIVMLQEGTGEKLDFGFWYKRPGVQEYDKVYGIDKDTFQISFSEPVIGVDAVQNNELTTKSQVASLISSSNSSTKTAISQTAHGLAVGDWVRFNGTAYVKANGAEPSTAYVGGMVSAVSGANNFTLTTSGEVSGLSGLTAGSPYYLSADTAGAMTKIPPHQNNTVVKPVFIATSSTGGIVQIKRGTVNVVARTYSRLGINFGISGIAFDEARYKQDLQYLGRYIKRLRITIPSWDDSTGITRTRQIVTLAKEMGFETTYGVTAAGMGHNAAYVDGWLAQVNTEAAWADANGVDVFYIGNEEDWWANPGVGGITGYTESQIQDMVLQKAQDLKTLYPNLTLAYSTAEGEFLQWDAKVGANADWQYLDKFGINMYNADFSGTLTYALSLAFGSKLFLSEWNDVANYPDGGKTASAYRAEILARRQAIEAAGIDAYFFTWDWGGSYGSTSDWGLSNGNGTYKPGIEELFSIPR